MERLARVTQDIFATNFIIYILDPEEFSESYYNLLLPYRQDLTEFQFMQIYLKMLPEAKKLATKIRKHRLKEYF